MFDGEADGDPVAMAAQAACALRGLAAAEAAGWGGDALLEVVESLEAARRALDATVLHALATLHRAGTCDEALGLSTSSWYARTAGVGVGAARRRLSTAVKLADTLTDADDALTRGEVGIHHADELAGATNVRNVDDMAAVVGDLCAAAPNVSFSAWTRQVRALGELFDPDGPRPDDDARNRLAMSWSGDSLWLRGELVGDIALTVRTALDAAADRCLDGLAADARAAGAPAPTRARARAEALHDLCRVSAAGAGPTLARHRATADVTLLLPAVDPARALDATTGHLVPDATGRLLLCDPTLHPVATTYEGSPLDAGRDHRVATPTIIRGLVARDGGCTHPGCDAPPAWCDAHHLRHWNNDGSTVLDNLCLLCRRHHRVLHRPDWHVNPRPDGTWTATTPHGRTLRSERRVLLSAGLTRAPDR